MGGGGGGILKYSNGLGLQPVCHIEYHLNKEYKFILFSEYSSDALIERNRSASETV